MDIFRWLHSYGSWETKEEISETLELNTNDFL